MSNSGKAISKLERVRGQIKQANSNLKRFNSSRCRKLRRRKRYWAGQLVKGLLRLERREGLDIIGQFKQL